MGLRVWLLAALLVCGLHGQERENVLRTDTLAAGEVSRILARVDAFEDEWVGEQDFEAINLKLKEIAQGIKSGQAGFDPLSDSLERFANLELAEFKIVGSSRADPQSAEADLRIRIELGGEAKEGGLLSLLGHAGMLWRREGSDWAFARADVGELREVRAGRRYFTEITDELFGAIPSFQAQLAPGIDHWRGTLDAAAGVSVYGHHGISAADADGDGLDDLFIAQPNGLPNLLYRNNGDGTFSDITKEAGLDVLDDTSMGLFVDVDNDGSPDLILVGASLLLFRNDGKGRFTYDPDSGLQPPPDRSALFTSAAAADYDLDGHLDIYVCSYDFWQAGETYDSPTPYYDATNGPPNLLFRNRGDGTFEEVTGVAGLMEGNDRFSFAAAWGDYDGDGYPDLYVANDFGRNNLYRNNGDGTFSDVAAAAGVEDLGAGMSAAWGDYDGDGRLDLYVGNMWSSAGQRLTFNPQFQRVAASEEVRQKFQRQARGNSLFRNNGDGTFNDVSEEAGVTMGRWAWASDFFDYDGDGRLDLLVQNGYITGDRIDDL